MDQVTVAQESGSNAGKWRLLLLAAIYVVGSLYFLVDMRGTVEQAGPGAGEPEQIADRTTRTEAAEAEAETLGSRSA